MTPCPKPSSATGLAATKEPLGSFLFVFLCILSLLFVFVEQFFCHFVA